MKGVKSIIIILLVIFFSFSFAKPPYVLLISFDGFRWDYLYKGITPNIEKNFIEKGVRALSFRPSFPSKTFPNHYSIITGQYVDHHGILANRFKNPFTGEKYSIKDSSEVTNPKWYLGKAFWETARRNGIITASLFWAGL